VFAGHGAGLYSTTDAGQTWVSNNVPSYLWRTIACTPDAKRGMAAVASGPSTSFIFLLSTPPPSLIISATWTNATLSWPTNSSGFQRQQTLAIGTLNWKDVTNAIVITNTQNTVTVLKTNSQAFFRLRGFDDNARFRSRIDHIHLRFEKSQRMADRFPPVMQKDPFAACRMSPC
jgi:hypothetical protein